MVSKAVRNRALIHCRSEYAGVQIVGKMTLQPLFPNIQYAHTLILFCYF